MKWLFEYFDPEKIVLDNTYNFWYELFDVSAKKEAHRLAHRIKNPTTASP